MSVALVTGRPGLAWAQSLDVVHSFGGEGHLATDGKFPEAALIRAADGNFYGTTAGGGDAGVGTVYRMTPGGTVTILYSFRGGDHSSDQGSFPRAPLVQGTDGNFWGTTSGGEPGSSDYCELRVFRTTPAGVTTLHATSCDFQPPVAPLIQASNGYLYAPFQQTDILSAYRISPSTGQVDYYALTPPPHTPPLGTIGNLVEATDGNFYGTASLGGAVGSGFVYRWNPTNPTGTFAVVHSFAGADGANPRSIIQGSDGNFYGTTETGGASNLGIVFKMTPGGTVTVLHSFAGGSDGRAPVTPLIQASDGLFYGTASGGASDLGVVYRVSASGSTTILHTFSGGITDGAQPEASLFQDVDGTFYGTTKQGGTINVGTIFRMTSAGTVTIVYAFGGTAKDGTTPKAGLVSIGSALYGTTSAGGANDLGTAFQVAADGTAGVVHHFGSGADGARPMANVIPGSDGNLYGTTSGGGGGSGTVFRMTPTGSVTLLHAFTGADGLQPDAPLVQTMDGSFIGTTARGGFFGAGTLFRITTSGAFTLLYEFAGAPMDGAQPEAGLIQGSDGNFYGTTFRGGAFDRGTVFKITPAGLFTLLYSFTGGADGAGPRAPLLRATDGALYGTTSGGGTLNAGTVFRVSASGALTTLHSFAGGRDGAFPYAGLMQAADGLLYGTTRGGGAFDAGTVFSMTTAGVVATMAALSGDDGSAPEAPLVQTADGALYGTTSAGGAFGLGIVFRLRLHAPPPPPTSVVAAQAGSTHVRLSWAPVATATSYTVRRAISHGAETTLVAGVPGTSFVDATAARNQRYYYIVTALNASGESLASYEVSITAGRVVQGDFDGDAAADVAVFRPATGRWYLKESATGAGVAIAWGGGADLLVPGDYDGDGLTDVAVFRPSTGQWFIRQSATSTLATVVWGGGADKPVPGDYDGDGLTDVAVFRPSTGQFFIRPSSTSTLITVAWGGIGDMPVPGDYDGDGLADVAVFRPATGTWYIRQSRTLTLASIPWGSTGDIPVAGDYDGDGKIDVAIFRPATGAWFVRSSSTLTPLTLAWGGGSDVPVPGDYDGDGQLDVAVFRPSSGMWYIRQSSTLTMTTLPWGASTDVPILKQP